MDCPKRVSPFTGGQQASIREGYPILKRMVGNGAERLVYLDSAATSLVPEAVLDAVVKYTRTSKSNVHRGAHRLAEESTDMVESTRELVATWIGSPSPSQIVFTHGATEALNHAALCWGATNLSESDRIAVAIDNHHSAMVPWLLIAERTGAAIEFIDIGGDGSYEDGSIEKAIAGKPKLVVLPWISNVLGYVQPRFMEIARAARSEGARVVADGAQAVGHGPVRIDENAMDFVAFSSHKMHALAGLGVLWCSRGAMEEMTPVVAGGGSVSRVAGTSVSFARGPRGFEAGTPPLEAIASLGAAIEYLDGLGLENVSAHTAGLCEAACTLLGGIPGVNVVGTGETQRESLVSFSVEGMHAHDVGHMLSKKGIAVRAGNHCAQPLHDRLGLAATLRASFAEHNGLSDVEKLASALAEAMPVR